MKIYIYTLNLNDHLIQVMQKKKNSIIVKYRSHKCCPLTQDFLFVVEHFRHSFCM